MVDILKLNIEQDFEEKKFGQDCSLIKILRLKFGRDSEAKFVSTCDMTLLSHFVESTLLFGPLVLPLAVFYTWFQLCNVNMMMLR